MSDYTLPPLPEHNGWNNELGKPYWLAAFVRHYGQQCAEAARAPLLLALRHLAVSLQEHFDGTGPEFSSSYHHAIVLPGMIRKALLGEPQSTLFQDEHAALGRFMADEPRDRPDRIVEMLREQRARIAELEAELAQAQKDGPDAKRYRFLRESNRFAPAVGAGAWGLAIGATNASAVELDAAVDSAMKESGDA